jgi:hypothetical protein
LRISKHVAAVVADAAPVAEQPVRQRHKPPSDRFARAAAVDHRLEKPCAVVTLES